jgi:DNA-binding MarR family transcriptional regulator
MASGEGVRRGTRDPAVLAWLRLERVRQQISRAAEACVRRSGLSLAQFDVLAQVGAFEGSSQKELAARLLVTKGNITQLLDRMEACGLLQRRQAGRSKTVCLTDKGRRLRDCVVPAMEATIREQLSALSAPEQRQLLATLRTVDRDLQNRPGGAQPALTPDDVAAG